MPDTAPIGNLITVSAGTRALAEARTLDEIRDVRAFAEAMRAGAKQRGLGIATENEAAELVVRSERKMGAELTSMKGSGALITSKQAGERGVARRRGVEEQEHGGLTYADLGISYNEHPERWVQLATIPNDAFEEIMQEVRELPDVRLSRVDFIRAWFGKAPKAGPVVSDRAEADEWTKAWASVVDAFAALGAKLDDGWPVQSDRTHRGWGEVNDQINSAGRTLLHFQKRVRLHLAATGEGEAK